MNSVLRYAKTHKVSFYSLCALALVLILSVALIFMNMSGSSGDVKSLDNQSDSNVSVGDKPNSVSGDETPKDMTESKNKATQKSGPTDKSTSKGKKTVKKNGDTTTVSEDGNTVTSEGSSVTKDNVEDNPAPGASGENPRDTSKKPKEEDNSNSGDKPKTDDKPKSDGKKDAKDPAPKKDTKNSANCNVSSGVSASKVLVVRGTGGAGAKVTQCAKNSDGAYKQVKTASGAVGYNGISASKREGDGKTPAGVYSLGKGFGVNSKPSSFSGSWAKVTKDDVWVDGKGGPKGYNTMKKKSDGYSGEDMYQTPAYNYGQVINYNTSNIADKGSAIFLHVNTGSGKTAGCVSVTQSYLLDTFGWGPTQIDIK